MAEKAKDQEVLETIIKAIVNKPDQVSVERTVDEMGVLLTLKVDPEDMGSVIGRKGQTIQAVRILLKIIGAKNNARVNLKIYDPNYEGQSNTPKNQSNGSNEKSDSLEDLEI